MLLPSVITKALVGAAAAGALTLGLGSTAAFAATPTAPAAANHKHCDDAGLRVARLADRQHDVEVRIERLQKARDKARDAHHDDRVAKLEARIDHLQKTRDRLADRIVKIRARCDVPDAAGAAPTPAH
ncbi:MAG: hypothetical protein NVS3B21_16560 [Acidimicrobiales bacterium]